MNIAFLTVSVPINIHVLKDKVRGTIKHVTP